LSGSNLFSVSFLLLSPQYYYDNCTETRDQRNNLLSFVDIMSFNFETYFGPTLETKSGVQNTSEVLSGKKLVRLAHEFRLPTYVMIGFRLRYILALIGALLVEVRQLPCNMANIKCVRFHTGVGIIVCQVCGGGGRCIGSCVLLQRQKPG
jgi:hypothetical protein